MKQVITLLILLITSPLYSQITIEKKLVIEGVQEPTFVGDKLVVPAECKLVVKEGIKVTIDKSYKFSDVLITKDGVVLNHPLTDGETLLTEPGKYNVNVVLFDPEKGIKRGQSDLVIGAVPPGPKPTPGPEPLPTPDQKIDNLSVLIIHETNDLGKYTVSQRAVIQSTDLQMFMNKTLPRDTGNQPLWRVLDKDVSFPVNCDTTFCKWMATVDKSKLPLLVIGNRDQIVYQGPIPEDTEKVTSVDAVKALILKHKK